MEHSHQVTIKLPRLVGGKELVLAIDAAIKDTGHLLSFSVKSDIRYEPGPVREVEIERTVEICVKFSTIRALASMGYSQDFIGRLSIVSETSGYSESFGYEAFKMETLGGWPPPPRQKRAFEKFVERLYFHINAAAASPS